MKCPYCGAEVTPNTKCEYCDSFVEKESSEYQEKEYGEQLEEFLVGTAKHLSKALQQSAEDLSNTFGYTPEDIADKLKQSSEDIANKFQQSSKDINNTFHQSATPENKRMVKKLIIAVIGAVILFVLVLFSFMFNSLRSAFVVLDGMYGYNTTNAPRIAIEEVILLDSDESVSTKL